MPQQTTHPNAKPARPASPAQAIESLNLQQEISIDATPEIVFDALLAELGPEGQMPGGEPFPFKLEAWPGGRWFRDLGNNTGHLWAHVQVIKPPKLLELSGPMFMSYPAANFVQYRLTPTGDSTQLKITHQAFGFIPKEDRDGVGEGWEHGLKRVREIALRLKAERGKGGKR